MESEAFAAEVLKLEEIKQKMLRRLNEDLFKSGPVLEYADPTFRDRMRWKYWAVKGYFHTLWKAIKGVELDEYRDCD